MAPDQPPSDAGLARGVLFGVIAWTLIGLAVLFCGGCTTYSNDTTRDVERTWLAMHAIDTVQTVNFSPCTREADPAAVAIYGSDKPTDARVLATNVALGWLHYTVGAWLDRRTETALADPDDTSAGGWWLARAAWHGFAIIGTGYSVLHNATSHYKCVGYATPRSVYPNKVPPRRVYRV